MRSQLPKVLHPLCGRPLVLWPVEAAREAGAERIVVILSPGSEDVQRVLPPGIEVAIQHEANGTGGAVSSARDKLEGSEHLIVLSGDHPLIDAAFVRALTERHAETSAAATVTSRVLEDPGQYGRVVRAANGDVEKIVETKAEGDATPEELAIKEVNLGTYAFATGPLLDALARIRPDNAQGELYLGDVLPLMREKGLRVVAHLVEDDSAGLGVNSRADLAAVRAVAQQRILEGHMLAGVTVTDPASTLIDVEVRIGEDTVIEPYTFLRGQVEIGARCRVGPMTTLTDCVLGPDVTVLHSYLDACEVVGGSTIGPFTHLRPGTKLEERAKAGSFVEIKNSQIGAGTKVPHLSYIGDADVGADANIGCGTITANYDGRRKHRTVIGNSVRTGVDTALIAPVIVGDGAYTGAGSVITDDVPEGALAIGRARQTNIEGYAEKAARRAEEQEKETKSG
jgi:bifunctional UDP-N-acetylglucosamine pyrophosphorylase / glucosamine-1-phosphate N-acetyltransferase